MNRQETLLTRNLVKRWIPLIENKKIKTRVRERLTNAELSTKAKVCGKLANVILSAKARFVESGRR